MRRRLTASTGGSSSRSSVTLMEPANINGKHFHPAFVLLLVLTLSALFLVVIWPFVTALPDHLPIAGSRSSSHRTVSAYDCKSADRLAWEPLTHTSLCNSVFIYEMASSKSPSPAERRSRS